MLYISGSYIHQLPKRSTYYIVQFHGYIELNRRRAIYERTRPNTHIWWWGDFWFHCGESLLCGELYICTHINIFVGVNIAYIFDLKFVNFIKCNLDSLLRSLRLNNFSITRLWLRLLFIRACWVLLPVKYIYFGLAFYELFYLNFLQCLMNSFDQKVYNCRQFCVHNFHLFNGFSRNFVY